MKGTFLPTSREVKGQERKSCFSGQVFVLIGPGSPCANWPRESQFLLCQPPWTIMAHFMPVPQVPSHRRATQTGVERNLVCRPKTDLRNATSWCPVRVVQQQNCDPNSCLLAAVLQQVRSEDILPLNLDVSPPCLITVVPLLGQLPCFVRTTFMICCLTFWAMQVDLQIYNRSFADRLNPQRH